MNILIKLSATGLDAGKTIDCIKAVRATTSMELSAAKDFVMKLKEKNEFVKTTVVGRRWDGVVGDWVPQQEEQSLKELKATGLFIIGGENADRDENHFSKVKSLLVDHVTDELKHNNFNAARSLIEVLEKLNSI